MVGGPRLFWRLDGKRMDMYDTGQGFNHSYIIVIVIVVGIGVGFALVGWGSTS